MVGNGEKQNGGKKDKNLDHRYQIMGRNNPSSKDKCTKNLRCVTENAKEFPEQARDYEIDIKVQSLAEMGNWKSVDKNSLAQGIIKGRPESLKRLILVKCCGATELENKTAIAKCEKWRNKEKEK